MSSDLIYLDMNIYNRPFDDQKQLRIRLETIACQIIFQLVQEQKVELAWPFMIEYENSLNPFPERRDEIMLLSQMARHIIEPSEIILQFSEKFEKIGVKNKDAVHLSCAEVFGCDFFITSDDKVINKAKTLSLKVDVCNPVDFIQEVKDYEK